MKKISYQFMLIVWGLLFSMRLFAAVTLITNSLPGPGNIQQGSLMKLVYALQVSVSSPPGALTSIQFTLTGTHDNNDLTNVKIWYREGAVNLYDAILICNVSGSFSAPHTYTITSFENNPSLLSPVGGYLMITVDVDAGATIGNTVKLNGWTNPVILEFADSPIIQNYQNDAAGLQTITAGNPTAQVTLTSIPIAAGNIAQGSDNNIVYIVKMDVTGFAVTAMKIQVTLTGTYDNNDIQLVRAYYNSAPSLSGASNINSVSGSFAAPHNYLIHFFQNGRTIAAGTTGYFIIVVKTTTTATNNNTIKLDGNANPVIFIYSSSLITETNTQTDAAGMQTIRAAEVTLSSIILPAADIAQGTSNNIVYIVKTDVAVYSVNISDITFTLTGTHDNDDLTNVVVFYNSVPSLSGAPLNLGSLPGLFAAPHTYTLNFAGKTIPAGSYMYFIITAGTATAATSGNTVKIDGNTNPVTLGLNLAPTIINNQTDAAGTQTIRASEVNLSSVAVPAADIAQGTSNNIVYIVKMDVAVYSVHISDIRFTLTGTHDNNDFNDIRVFTNSVPSLAGKVFYGYSYNFYAAPHWYVITGNKVIPAGSSIYFIIIVGTATAATSGNTVKIDGNANPVTFSYNTLVPNISNNQTDAAGTQTIRASEVNLSSVTVPAADIPQGTGNKIIYITKADVAFFNITLTNIQFTLTGTHDNNDLTNVVVYMNSVPSLSGSPINLGTVSGLFAAPHSYTISGFGSKIIDAGSTSYFIITVTTATNATGGNTVKLNGNANPVTLGLTLAPTIINSQADVAGPQTIRAADIMLTSIPVPASEILQGTANNIVYIAKMEVSAFWIMLNSINFTLTGTHDNNDLTSVVVYINYSAPTITGAAIFGSSSGLYAAPHNYIITSGLKTIDNGQSAYFIITVTTAAAATIGNSVILNGFVNPVSFGYYYSTPNLTNNQSNVAGAKTIIESPLPLTLISFTGNLLNRQSVQLQWVTAAEINTKDFEVEWGKDGSNFTNIAVVAAEGNSSQNKHYNYIHTLPDDGNNYYRLKMTDIDGRFTYSPVVNVKYANSSTGITAYPNPVINVAQLQLWAEKEESIILNLHGADGRILGSRSFYVAKGNNRLSWDMQQLAAGYYFISSRNKQFVTIKIIKQ